MKKETEKRITDLEVKNNIGKGTRSAFIQFVWPGHIDRPVNGWSFEKDGERVEVLRGEGEENDNLKQRALTQARKHLGEQVTPCLISLGRAGVAEDGRRH